MCGCVCGNRSVGCVAGKCYVSPVAAHNPWRHTHTHTHTTTTCYTSLLHIMLTRYLYIYMYEFVYIYIYKYIQTYIYGYTYIYIYVQFGMLTCYLLLHTMLTCYTCYTQYLPVTHPSPRMCLFCRISSLL